MGYKDKQDKPHTLDYFRQGEMFFCLKTEEKENNSATKQTPCYSTAQCQERGQRPYRDRQKGASSASNAIAQHGAGREDRGPYRNKQKEAFSASRRE